MAGPVSAQDAQPAQPPGDTCILEFNLPDRATIALDGRDYGAKRELKWNGLTSDQIYRSKAEIRFAGGEREASQVFVEGGRRTKLALAGPATGRPELMLQTGDTGGDVAWSPDGRYVMAGRILCDPISGRHLRSFPNPRSHMLCVAFSPGDQRIAMAATSSPFQPTVGDYDNVYFWDAASGRQFKTYAGPVRNLVAAWGLTGRFFLGFRFQVSVFGIRVSGTSSSLYREAVVFHSPGSPRYGEAVVRGAPWVLVGKTHPIRRRRYTTVAMLPHFVVVWLIEHRFRQM